MKTVVVTGVHGFVGESVYKKLIQSGYTVIPLVRREDPVLQNSITWDITKPYSGKKIPVDCVVHCAGLVDDWVSYGDAHKVNVNGVKHVLDAFFEVEKFIYVSSASVYNPTNKELVLTEESRAGTSLLNGYSDSKYEAERLIFSHPSTSQKTILRPHIIYGENDKKIIPRLLEAHKFGRFIVLGNGKNRLSVTHVDNLCAAILCAIENKSNFKKEVFNIADSEGVCVTNLISHIKNKFSITSKNLHIPSVVANIIGVISVTLFRIIHAKKPPLITRYVVYQMTSDHILSIEKAKNILGYNPTKSFTDF